MKTIIAVIGLFALTILAIIKPQYSILAILTVGIFMSILYTIYFGNKIKEFYNYFKYRKRGK